MMFDKKLTMGVIIPVGNHSKYLGDVIDALNKQIRKPDELIIVSDMIEDTSLHYLDRLKPEYKLVHTDYAEGRYGVSSARNIGAEESTAEILIFLDSDVLLPEDYLEKLEKDFKAEGSKVNGILGISAEDCCFPDFFSNYKNIWMRYTYYRLSGAVGTLNTSCFAITRNAFFTSGGFDEFRRKDLEDAIYGDKLRKKGYVIKVNNKLEYVHKKEYTLSTAVKTDIFRSKKLTEYNMQLLMKDEKKTRSSIPFGYFLGIPLFYLAFFFIAVAFFNPYAILLSFFCLILATLVNIDYLIFIYKIKGPGFTLKAILYQFMVFGSSGLGILVGIKNSISFIIYSIMSKQRRKAR
jgi:glycosyltransferase involved in cell wall biosynthesis